MATMEKLFVQIFETKKWIIDQAKHQSNLFDQHLASKLIIDGIVPPPWLHSSFLPPSISHLEVAEVNKNFVSGVEFPRSPLETHFSLNEGLVADRWEELRHRSNEEAVSLNDDFDAGIRSSVLPQCNISDADFALNYAPYHDTSPFSPQGRGGVVSENFQDPTLSLARLHRSKSRQRALELRNSVKSARCRSRCEDKDDCIAGGITGSAIDLLRVDLEDESKLVKPSSSCKGIVSAEEETNVCCEQKDISVCSDKITIVGSPGLQSSSINVDNSFKSSSKDEGLCVAAGSTKDSCQVNEQFDLRRPLSGKIDYCEEGSGYGRCEEYNFDNADQFRLQCSSLDEDKSLCISLEDERACPGSSKLHSDQVDEQLPKPSSSNIECREETLLEHCRSQECNLDNALQSGSQHSNLDADDYGKLLDLSKPSSANIECCEETVLGHCRNWECNLNSAQGSGSQYSSQDVDNSSNVDSENGRSCPIGNSTVHSVQVEEQLDLSKSSSDNMDCCEEEILTHIRSQECKFSDAQQSGMQHSSLDADNPPCLSSEDGTLCHVGSSKRHSDQVSEPLALSRPTSVNIECHEEGLGGCTTQDNNFDNNAEQSSLEKISSSPIMEVREKTSGKKPSTFLDDKRAVNKKGKCNSSLPVPVPQIQVDSGKEDDSSKGVSESHSEKRYQDRGYLNGNSLSSDDTSLLGHEKVIACSLLQSDEPSEQNSSLKDGTSNFQFSHENVVEIPHVDTEDALVLMRDTETFRDLMVMAPGAPSAGERDSNLEQKLKSSGVSQCKDSDSFEGYIGDFNGNPHCTSTECQTAEKVKELKAFCSVSKASSSHENQRMVELQLENSIDASLSLRNEKLQVINRSPVDKKLMQEFDYEKPVLDFQRLSFCEEGYLQPNVNMSPVEILQLEKEAHIVQGSESSSTLTAKEDLSRFGSNSRGTMLQNVMLENQSLDTKENFQFGDSELPADTGKTEGEEENGKLTSYSLITPHIQTSHYRGADKDKPALERFLMQADDEQPCISVGGINFDKLDLSKCLIERASILEKLCKSACINSPLSSSLESFKLNKVTDLYHSLPNGLPESMDLGSNLLMNDQNNLLKDGSNFLNREVIYSPHGRSFSDCLQSFSSNSAGEVRKPFASPFGKFLDRNSLNSSSSGKRSSQNIELPCISEEAENTDEVDDDFSKDMGSKERVPLADITENESVQVTVSEAARFTDRLSLESLNTELSNTGTHNRTKENLTQKSSKRKYLNEAVNHDILPVGNGAKRVTRSSYNRFSRSDLSCKENFRKEGPRFSENESKHKNIVSNVTSFIPLLQQREAPTILKGKRDIKVRAIEAAEAAKRLAEKKENERQMKKEALKLERARMEQENLRQIEVEKKKKDEERKKKEEERKKKEADMAAKKRQREEEERKEKERKRMRVEEVRRRLREHGGKLKSDKENKEAKPQANDQKPRDRKGCRDGTDKRDKESGHDNFDKLSVIESKASSTSDAGRASFVVEDSHTTSVGSLEAEALENVMENRISETSTEQSYQISPYKASDDEDEEDGDGDDGLQNNKFVPSWASKDRLAVLFASQQKLNPEIIFPPKSFCDIAEVLLCRKHQLK
ncbi:titin homolog isoform X1 [Cucurbita pepo subsp. pepo]|uniref:titin homolog isoform X1 n=1 Tax=Cucurbita pepo subsp. pepo TaxID=3664 RepID=UPI000C9D3037|nr:titin homolog isoform X1 [Cucurbita pepo subsp. pepo]